MAFQFKQFSAEDQQSSMRVGSDAVLLGAWANVSLDLRILEIGTGCGVISLMLAQRTNAIIDAIDIDLPSCLQAQQNFEISLWNERLHAIPQSLQEYARNCNEKYDHILTNPPFFRNSLKSPNPLKNYAKHESLLSLEHLLHGISQLLDKNGKLSLILPFIESKVFISLAEGISLFMSRKMEIKPTTNKPANRVLMEFSYDPIKEISSKYLTIRNEDSSYTTEYRTFTEPYYFSLK